MPVFFIHGVNVRKSDPNYDNGVTARNELLQRMVLQPLAATHPELNQIKIVSPYWGDSGVSFHWNLASVPGFASEALQGLEMVTSDRRAVDQITAATIAEIAVAARPVMAENGHAPFGPEDAAEGAMEAEVGPVTRAARYDLLRLTESLMTPLFMDETTLVDAAHNEAAESDVDASPDEGRLQAQLAMAVFAVANDSEIQKKVHQAASDQAVIDLLTHAVQVRFVQEVQAARTTESALAHDDGGEEALLPPWLQRATENIGSLFGRALSAPVETIVSALVEQQREPLHRNLARFLGDIFVYLNARGEVDTPGPIVAAVLDALRTAPRGRADEPVIVITHSMGGNILYDLITHYAPELQIDVWISVGGQIAQFEEMKLFRASVPALGAPHKVAKPGVGYWLNVYDTADILSFRVAPVFAGVNADEAYDTGASVLKAHGEYFGRASFYDLVRRHLELAL